MIKHVIILIILSFNLLKISYAMQKEILLCKNQETIEEEFVQLRRSLDRLMQPILLDVPVKEYIKNTKINDSDFQKGDSLYENAKSATPVRMSHNGNAEDFYKITENTYLQALECFINTYKKNRTESFPYIYQTVTNILDIQIIRKAIEIDSYEINSKLIDLKDIIVRIKEQEKERQKTVLAATGAETNSSLAEAHKLVLKARSMQNAIKTDEEQNYITIEEVYIQAIDLLFQAHEQNLPIALSKSEEVINESIAFCATRKPGSSIYFLSEAISNRFETLRKYKNQNPLLYKKVAI